MKEEESDDVLEVGVEGWGLGAQAKEWPPKEARVLLGVGTGGGPLQSLLCCWEFVKETAEEKEHHGLVGRCGENPYIPTLKMVHEDVVSRGLPWWPNG